VVSQTEGTRGSWSVEGRQLVLRTIMMAFSFII